jgi:hypothetical protein
MSRLLARILHDSQSEYIDPIGFDMLTQMLRPSIPMHVSPHSVKVYRIHLDPRHNIDASAPSFPSIMPERLPCLTAKYHILSCVHPQSCVPSMFIGFVRSATSMHSFLPSNAPKLHPFCHSQTLYPFLGPLPAHTLMLSSKITRLSKSNHEITLVLFSYAYGALSCG